MGNSTTLNDLFKSLQEQMIAGLNSSKIIRHPTDKGDNAEVEWISWFNKYLPNRYKAAKATVIDSSGGISEQIDVVLYDSQYSYLACNNNDILYVPAESVYAVFEVKQKLTKEYMEYAGKKAESVRNLYRTSAPIPYANGCYNPKKLHRIISGILTTTSSWANTYGTPFRNCLQKFIENQQVDCGCVLKEGSFFFDYEKSLLKTSDKNESLVFFFLELLSSLREMGTVPAIDFGAYEQSLSLHEEKLEWQNKKTLMNS